MLLWINGPQGGGKTQTAHELHRRLPGSYVCDPERVGFGLHGMTPPALRGDFQDRPAWRQGVFEVLDDALNATVGPLVAPMTIVNPDYFAETVGRLRERGHRVHHFALLARPETVLNRIRRRGGGRLLGRVAGPDPYALSRVDYYLQRLQDAMFAQHVWTDELSIRQVVERIADSAGLGLAEDTDSPMRAALRRGSVTVRHIRLG